MLPRGKAAFSASLEIAANPLIFLASRKGIEPLTPGLGNLCSILLSYRDPVDAVIGRPPRMTRKMTAHDKPAIDASPSIASSP